MASQKIGTQEEWATARAALQAREEEHARLGDELARQRRELPWVPVEKDYRFETEDGTKTLPDLFDGRSQLMVYHFMFGPSWNAGCPACSSIADKPTANASADERGNLCDTASAQSDTLGGGALSHQS